jgi:restriction system protein
MVLDWLKAHAAAAARDPSSPPATLNQGMLWNHVPYQEEAPAITSLAELDGAIEHLH